MSNNTTLSEFFDDPELIETQLGEDDLFAIFESLDSVADFPPVTPLNDNNTITDHPTAETDQLAIETSTSPKGNKRQKTSRSSSSTTLDVENNTENGQQRMSHITVERNRRKQMNEHLSVLRSLMPCFYVKRGDQASIIGGVVNYINELQQVLQSLEAKKQRKVVYNEVLSPRLTSSSPSISSPRPSPQVLSPRKPPLSPRLNLPISPKTPQPPPTSPYRPPPPALAPAAKLLQQQQQSYTLSPSSSTSSPSQSSNSANTSMNFDSNNVVVNELVANSKSAVADVEVKFCGPNLILKTVSPKISGQTAKIISTLEELSLEILQVNISSIEDTLFNSFTIKIGIECQLSAEELAQQIQQTFC